MAQVDLNLLNALDVLLAEGSVTAAADRLELSVPATSRTLARIREAFGDPIFVRAGRGLVPTPRALDIQARVHRLVEEAHAIVDAERELDLGALERTFTIRANDALISLLAVNLVGRVSDVAPGARLRFMSEGDEDLATLRDGTIDLDVGVLHDFGAEVRTEDLYEDDYVGMVASGHALARGRITLDRFASAFHVTVSRRGRVQGALDAALDARGLTRRVVAVVPTFTSAAQMILNSDLTGLLPARFAAQVAAFSGARVFAVPIDLPRISIQQGWHIRHDTDPSHRWLREQLRDSVRPA